MAGVEILVVSGLSRTRTPTVHSPDFQILYPLSGAFHWHLGSTRSLLDQNQVLFIAAGDESQDSHPDRGDVAGLLITPDVRLLESIWGCSIDRLAAHVSFDWRVLPSDPGLQQIAAALSNCRLVSQPPDQAVLEEAVIDLLSLTVRRCSVPTAPGKSVHRLAVPFSGQYPDGDLVMTPDGTRANFVSFRPVNGVPRSDGEIWTIERTDSGWGEPRHVAELSSPGDEWFPTLTADGTMYFGSSREGGLGGHDIWRSRLVDGVHQAPENLGAPVNSAGRRSRPSSRRTRTCWS
jgi:hypothetical protein